MKSFKTFSIIHTIVITVMSISLCSCFDRGITSEKELLLDKKNLIYNNDVDSYLKLENYYDEHSSDYYDLFPHSLKAMKENGIGYSDFFKTYLRISFKNSYDLKNISKLSIKEREFLVEILVEGSKSGDFVCDSILSKLNPLVQGYK